MTDKTNTPTKYTSEYLAQLLKDKKQITAFPNLFTHTERLLNQEISKVRSSLFHSNISRNGTSSPEALLPAADGGPIIKLSKKIFVPIDKYPEFNFIGRILGPRGMTAKQMEQEIGCKIMIRGKGSMRNRIKEEENKGKQSWEHLEERLHVLIIVEDTEERSNIKINKATEEIEKLLVPSADGEDELKKIQLMELAILNGTFRDFSFNKSPPSNVSSPTISPLALAGTNFIAAASPNTSPTQLHPFGFILPAHRASQLGPAPGTAAPGFTLAAPLLDASTLLYHNPSFDYSCFLSQQQQQHQATHVPPSNAPLHASLPYGISPMLNEIFANNAAAAALASAAIANSSNNNTSPPTPFDCFAGANKCKRKNSERNCGPPSKQHAHKISEVSAPHTNNIRTSSQSPTSCAPAASNDVAKNCTTTHQPTEHNFVSSNNTSPPFPCTNNTTNSPPHTFPYVSPSFASAALQPPPVHQTSFFCNGGKNALLPLPSFVPLSLLAPK